jgi:hypothetical protein
VVFTSLAGTTTTAAFVGVPGWSLPGTTSVTLICRTGTPARYGSRRYGTATARTSSLTGTA